MAESDSINNSEHTCAGRTDGYGGFTCVKCGEYHEAERYKKTQPDKLPVNNTVAKWRKLTVTDLTQLIYQLIEFQKANTCIAGWESDGKIPAITFHYLDKSEVNNE
jgi:hypothetical protein